VEIKEVISLSAIKTNINHSTVFAVSSFLQLGRRAQGMCLDEFLPHPFFRVKVI
jgi:hypothetical protein